MPNKKSNELLKRFEGDLKNLNRTRIKQESLFDNDSIALRDIEEIYSGLYLGFWGHFEAFLEELFINLLIGKIKHSNKSKIHPRVKVNSEIVARDLIYNGKNYVTWLPYENNIEKRSEIFFRGGRPFTLLERKDKDILHKGLIIRNALAHQSPYSLLKFNDIVLNGLILNPKEKKPKSFLRSEFSASPYKNRYEHYTNEIYGIAIKLC